MSRWEKIWLSGTIMWGVLAVIRPGDGPFILMMIHGLLFILWEGKGVAE